MRAALRVAALLWATVAAGGALAQTQGARPRTAGEVFKNVQILRGVPVDEFMGTMGFFSASTGLNCTDCHIEESGGDWARYADDNDLKRTARRMMLMVDAINRANFGGRQVVTCSTCHRGNSRPGVMPSLDLLYSEPPADEPGDPFEHLPGQPSPETILDAYVAATGGAARAGALTAIAATGTYNTFDDAERHPLELYATALGQRAIVARQPAGVSMWVVNGARGWMTAPATDRPIPVIEITGQELEGLRVEAELFFPARVKTLLRNWRTGPPMVLEDDREVQVVQGETTGGAVVTLCFDRATGLLARMVRFAASPVGRLVTRVDYEAYSDVAGVKVPSKWTVRWLSGRSRYELTGIQANPRIDPTRFSGGQTPVQGDSTP